MTDPIQRFLEYTTENLEKPINAYYDVFDHPATGVFSGIRDRIARFAARNNAEESLQDTLHQAHYGAATLAQNGHLSPDAEQRVRAIIDEQTNYLRGFIDALPDLTREAALARARSYLSAIVQTYSEVATLDLPTLPHQPGDRDLACKGFCKCRLRVVRLNERDADVYWDLDFDAEHCPDCIALSTAWNPLQIRNRKIINEKQLSPHIKAMIYLASMENIQ